MESEKTNEGELTSTMGSFMSTTKEEKSDNSDSTPTSSTDAFTTTSKSLIAADDPISSTSSDVIDSRKNTGKHIEFERSCTTSNSTMEFVKETSIGDNNPSPIVSEKDLFEINISDTSTEKITENFDDLVQDLENLLGEPTTSFDFNIRPRDVKKTSNESDKKDVPMDLDAFSAELQGLGEKSTNLGETVKNSSTHLTVEVQDSLIDATGDDVNKDSNTENVPTNSTTESASTCIQEDSRETEGDNKTVDSIKSSVTDDKPEDIDKSQPKEEQSCQSEVVSASTEVSEKTDVTSTENTISSQDDSDKKEDVDVSNEVLSTEAKNDDDVRTETVTEDKVVASSEEIPDSVEPVSENVATSEKIEHGDQGMSEKSVDVVEQKQESSENENVATCERIEDGDQEMSKTIELGDVVEQKQELSENKNVVTCERIEDGDQGMSKTVELVDVVQQKPESTENENVGTCEKIEDADQEMSKTIELVDVVQQNQESSEIENVVTCESIEDGDQELSKTMELVDVVEQKQESSKNENVATCERIEDGDQEMSKTVMDVVEQKQESSKDENVATCEKIEDGDQEMSKTIELVDVVEQKQESSDVSETKDETRQIDDKIESLEMVEIQNAKVEDPPTCASSTEAIDYEMQQSNEKAEELSKLVGTEVELKNDQAEEHTEKEVSQSEKLEVHTEAEVQQSGKLKEHTEEEVQQESEKPAEDTEAQVQQSEKLEEHVEDEVQQESEKPAEDSEAQVQQSEELEKHVEEEVQQESEKPAGDTEAQVQQSEKLEEYAGEEVQQGSEKLPEDTEKEVQQRSEKVEDLSQSVVVAATEEMDVDDLQKDTENAVATIVSEENMEVQNIDKCEDSVEVAVESSERKEVVGFASVEDKNENNLESKDDGIGGGDQSDDKKESVVADLNIVSSEQQEEPDTKEMAEVVNKVALSTPALVETDKVKEVDDTVTDSSSVVIEDKVERNEKSLEVAVTESTEVVEETQEADIVGVDEGNRDQKQDEMEVEVEAAVQKQIEEPVVTEVTEEKQGVDIVGVHEDQEPDRMEVEQKQVEEPVVTETVDEKVDIEQQEEKNEMSKKESLEQKVETVSGEVGEEKEKEEVGDVTESIDSQVPQTETQEQINVPEVDIIPSHVHQDQVVVSEENQVDVLDALVGIDCKISELQSNPSLEKIDVIDSGAKQFSLVVEEIFEVDDKKESIENARDEVDEITTKVVDLESENEIKSPFLDPAVDIPPVEFIPDTLDMPTHSLAEDLDLLVQNTVDESISSTSPSIEATVSLVIPPSEIEMAISSVDSPKLIREEAISNPMLPLEDVPDLDVLNAISSLDESKATPTVSEADALLTSSTLEESFESNIETVLPTVDEIFVEPSQQPDDNLETLLAVASLQSDDYNIPTEGDFVSTVGQMADFSSVEPTPVIGEVFSVEESPKLQDTKIESLSEVKENDESQQQKEDKLKEPLVINIDDSEKERIYSPKITIKPIKPPEDDQQDAVSSASGDAETSKGSLKMTITKQSDNTHSILKIYNPGDENVQDEPHSQSEPTVPKLIIKSIVQQNEQPHSPKLSSRNSKQVFSPPSSEKQRSSSPRITIKPIPKPEESVSPLKITIKPLKTDESHKQKHSPKLTIKPIPKPEEESNSEPKVHSPRVTIKPIVKPVEEIEQVTSPRLTIKPIVKPPEELEQVSSPRVTIKPIVKHLEESPRITIKPIVKPTEVITEPTSTTLTTPRLNIKPVVKPHEKEKISETSEQGERSSPKITIKPIVQPSPPPPLEDFEESIKERIVLKINKGTIPGGSKELRKREVPLEEEKSEKLAKIKVKFSKQGGHPQIVQDQSPTKRSAEQPDHDKNKRQRIETDHLSGITITPIIAPGTHSKLKEMLSRNVSSNDKPVRIEDDDDDVTIVEDTKKSAAVASPIVISEESNQDSMNAAMLDLRDPISEIPVFEITPDSVKTINPVSGTPIVEVPVAPPAPRKRGRPRKVPLQVREDFKDPKDEEPKPIVVESTRPKRSCRGQSVRTTLGIKPRKPRGPGRGRGSKRGMGTRSISTPPDTPPKGAKLRKRLKTKN